jgi:tetratricopeptide (TPR) repeat protein
VLGRGFGLGAGGLGQAESSLPSRLSTFADGLLTLARLFVWPAPLSVDYEAGQTATLSASGGLAVLVLGCLGLLWCWPRTGRTSTRLALSLALLFFVPTSGLLVTLKSPFADRFVLISLGFLCLAVASASRGLAPGIRRPAAAIALLALAATTVNRSREWASQESLFAAEVRHHPGSVQAHLGLGSAAMEARDWSSARRSLEQVVELTTSSDPRSLAAIANLAAVEFEAGDRDAAAIWAARGREELLRSPPPNATPPTELDLRFRRIWIVLANVLRSRGELEAAAGITEEGLSLFGREPDLLESLAILSDQAGRPREAEALYREILELTGPTPRLCYHLALALLHQDRREEAREWLRRTLELDPGHRLARERLSGL